MASQKQCDFCKKSYVGTKESNDKCKECENEFKTVVANVMKRFSGALKGLADK